VVGTLTEINGYLISFFRGQMVVSLIDGALVAVALTSIGLPYALLIGVFLAILGLIPYIGNLMVMVPAILIAIAHFGAVSWGAVVQNETPVVGGIAMVQVDGGGSGEVAAKAGEITAKPAKADRYVVTSVSADGKRAEVLLHAWTWLPNVWIYPVIVLVIFVTLQQVNGLVTAPRIVGDSVGLHPLTVIFPSGRASRGAPCRAPDGRDQGAFPEIFVGAAPRSCGRAENLGQVIDRAGGFIRSR